MDIEFGYGCGFGGGMAMALGEVRSWLQVLGIVIGFKAWEWPWSKEVWLCEYRSREVLCYATIGLYISCVP